MRKKEQLSPYGHFVVFVVAFGGILFGYNTGIISGALVFISPAFQLSTVQEGMVVSLILLGALFGALSAGFFADRIGRKNTLFLTALLFMLGTLIIATADTYSQLLWGRCIGGLALGLVSVVSPLYLGETAPPHYRGRCVSLFQLFIALGILCAYITAVAFAPEQRWRPLFVIGAVPALLQFIAIFLIPETPIFSAASGKYPLAKRTLTQLRLDKAWEADLPKMQHKHKMSLKACFKKNMLYVIAIGALLSIFQQITGINAIIYYTPKIFAVSGISNTLIATLAIGVINTLATVVSLWLMDIAGRRRLLLIGVSGMLISLAVLAWAFLSNSVFIDKIAVACLMVFVASFAISFGPVTWVILSEIFPLKIRGAAIAISLVLNWLSNYALALTFPQLITHLGGGTMFAIFAGIALLALYFVYSMIPETKGKTLEEIETLVNTGKFR